jgi:broad specificity phosphatase PhoE
VGSLLLIRHGQASYGQADYDRLSPRGEEQARALGRFLASERVDHVFVGPHVRQQSTATLAAEAAGNWPEPVTLAELAEYPAVALLHHFLPRLVAEEPRFASLTEAPTRELVNDGFHAIIGRWARDEWRAEGVEHVAAFADRVRSGLDRIIREARRGARTAIVTSAGPIGVAIGLTFGATPHHMVRTSVVVRNASISELKFRSQDFDWHPERVTLVAFNSTHHLPADLQTEY